MAIFFKLVTPGAVYPTAGSPDISLPKEWQPKKIEVVNEDQTATNDAYISFDGSTDAGHVIGGTGEGAKITFTAQAGINKIWFKKGGGSAPVLRVFIEQ